MNYVKFVLKANHRTCSSVYTEVIIYFLLTLLAFNVNNVGIKHDIAFQGLLSSFEKGFL